MLHAQGSARLVPIPKTALHAHLATHSPTNLYHPWANALDASNPAASAWAAPPYAHAAFMGTGSSGGTANPYLITTLTYL